MFKKNNGTGRTTTRKSLALAVALFAAGLSNLGLAEQRSDYDLDNDGLIEINDLADLNQIRFSLNGQSLYGSNIGCPASGCVGFEQTVDVDFDINQDGVVNSLDGVSSNGFVPIGSQDSPFIAIYDGAGHEIINLVIKQDYENFIGLFGATSNAEIKNLGLTGPLMSVTGYYYVGGLIGSADDTAVSSVYASGEVIGSGKLGGLIGRAYNSSLIATYSNVSVDGFSYTGGVIGISTGTTLSSSYSIGPVKANYYVGALIGAAHYTSAVEDSYWAWDTTGHTFSSGSSKTSGVTLEELKCPTSADDTACSDIMLFDGWDNLLGSNGAPVWGFGSSEDLPTFM